MSFIGNGLFAAIVLCAVFSPCVDGAHAEEFVVADHPLNLVPPEGYCQASKQSAEAPLIEAVESGLADNVLLMVFADCAELREFRKGLANGFRRYGQYMAPKIQGKVVIVPRGMSQHDFMRQVLATFNTEDSQAPLDRAIAQVQRKFPELNIGEGKFLGVIESQTAIYTGYLMKTRERDDIARYVADVTGVTVLSDVLIATHLFQRSEAVPDLASLLAIQKVNTKILRNRNQ